MKACFHFIFICASCLNLVFGAVLIVGAQTQETKPNILWIVSEDNNVTMVGCYGNRFATTPNIDNLAKEGVRYTNAFSTAPVCAPSRCTLITGMYPPTLGTEHMRSTYPIPSYIKFFPRYLREAGYYTSNNSKKDYNTIDQLETWDESSDRATYKNRKDGQPFFAVFNLFVSHESSIHVRQDSLRHDPRKVPLPAYHPDTREFREDWAQYYDKVETMDQQVGKLLKELEEAGLAENTIVFYYADNGGVLPRSKRFMFESGLHVPLVIRIPKKYEHLRGDLPGTTTDRLVTFTDFAPTVLSLTGIKIPDYIQGHAFLGPQAATQRQYAYAFRGRMDERIDLSRSVRDKKYRYVRNYLPHLIYAQHLPYMWLSASMKSWEKEFAAGHLNAAQAAFWKEKPSEELYDVAGDPDNVNNLAGKPGYEDILKKMRKVNHDQLISSRDAGFIPEAILYEFLAKGADELSRFTATKELDKIIETAEIASSRDVKNVSIILQRLGDADPSIRYWAATGCTILKINSADAKSQLLNLLQDPEGAVRVAAAEALYSVGDREKGLKGLVEALSHPNPFVKVQSLNVLQGMGKEALPAVDAVRKLVPPGPATPMPQDDNFDVRAARGLLETLKP